MNQWTNHFLQSLLSGRMRGEELRFLIDPATSPPRVVDAIMREADTSSAQDVLQMGRNGLLGRAFMLAVLGRLGRGKAIPN